VVSVIHQHVVDAHAAQTATPNIKPIGVVFALCGFHASRETVIALLREYEIA